MAFFKKRLTITKPILMGLGCWVILWTGVVLASLGGPARAGEDNLATGFLYDDFDLTLEPGHRTEAAGPFYYSEQKESEETLAFPPFFSAYKYAAVTHGELDVVYPFFTYEYYACLL